MILIYQEQKLRKNKKSFEVKREIIFKNFLQIQELKVTKKLDKH